MLTIKSIKTKNGFTFIELSLAILIVSLLALTIVLVANSITAIATKGLSLKSVNSVGSELSDELFTSIGISPATDFDTICDTVYTVVNGATSTTAQQRCKADAAFQYVFSERRLAGVKIKDSDAAPVDVQLSGVFCTGRFSYVWNTGYSIAQDIYTDYYGNPIPPAIIKLEGDGEIQGFRLLRFEDYNRDICASRILERENLTSGYGHLTDDRVYDFSALAFPSDPVELIPESDADLALYNFYVARPAQDHSTSRIFYSGSFVLATLRGGVNIFATGDYCQLKGETADFNYCAVNKFNFAAQALGK